MREYGHIEAKRADTSPAVKQLERDVFDDGPWLDIDAFADELLEEVARSENISRATIIELLRAEALPKGEYGIGKGVLSVRPESSHFIYDYVDETGDHQVTLPKREFYAYVRALRKRVYEAMQRRNAERMHVLDELLSKRVVNTHGEFVLKERSHIGREAIRQIDQALDYLFSLPTRSPYIHYAETIWDGRDVSRRILERKKNFVTMVDALKTGRVSSLEALQIYIDFVRANGFLVEHGLRCSDLDLLNIGVDPKTHRGFAFDFDGLRLQGRYATYVTKYSHLPPERYDADAPTEFRGYTYDQIPIVVPSVKYWKSTPITEAEMVYELGVSLRELLAIIDLSKNNENLLFMREIARDMCSEDALDRPDIEEVLRDLTEEFEYLSKHIPERKQPVDVQQMHETVAAPESRDANKQAPTNAGVKKELPNLDIAV